MMKHWPKKSQQRLPTSRTPRFLQIMNKANPMETKLHAKTILVIGGTSGIGFTVAQMAAQAGARLIVTGRNQARLEAALKKLQAVTPEVSGAQLDAANPQQLVDFFATVKPFDHLVSMAGGFMGGGFLNAPLEVIRKAIEEKLFANLQIARLANSKLCDGGSMVFTAGSGGRPQNASGAIIGNDAIRTMVKGLAVELAPRARANAVAPTWTRTPLWDHLSQTEIDATERHFAATIPLGRTAKIEEVASAYLFLMQNNFITGQTIAVDGGVDLV